MARARLWRLLKPPRKLKLTRDGRYFVAITIGVGLAAINTGNNLLYLLLGWLLSVIIASGVLSETSMRGLTVTRRHAGRIHAGRPFLTEISVKNEKSSIGSYSVEIEDLLGGKPIDKKCYFLKVPAGKTQRTSYRHTFPKRGLYRCEGFRISTRFPFGLFHKSRDVEAPGEVLVYPAVFDVPPPARRALSLGDAAVGRIGRRGEFFGLREYRSGDDRRSIHWRSSARTGRLMVRELEEEAQERATILLDNALPGEPDEAQGEALEQAVSLAASLARSYLSRGFAVRLAARGLAIPFSTGEAQLARILRELALLETADEDSPLPAPAGPAGESILVLPRGLPTMVGRPERVTHVMEAG